MNILSRIRGEHISEASKTLPDCETAQHQFLEAEFDVPDFGKVLVLFKRFHHKHGKSTNWFWSAQAAVMAADVDCGA